MRTIAVFLLLFVIVAFAADRATVDPPADGTYTMTPVEEGTSGTDLTISFTGESERLYVPLGA